MNKNTRNFQLRVLYEIIKRVKKNLGQVNISRAFIVHRAYEIKIVKEKNKNTFFFYKK